MGRTRVLFQGAPDQIERFAARFPDVEFVPVPRNGLPDDSKPAEVLLTSSIGSDTIDALLDRGVGWVHVLGTGVERFPLDAVGDRVLTCSRGSVAVPIAEWVMATVLAAAKRLPDTWVSEPPEGWYAAELAPLAGQRLALIGFGSIARAVAVRALAFDMEVVAFRRSGRPSEMANVTVSETLAEAVAGAAHVVVAAAATPETRHLIDGAAFAAMDRGAHLVNIARGSLVDQEALRAALADGIIGLASLDTVEPEPLPEGHWMYGHPSVRISPHISWQSPAGISTQYDMFAENLERYLVGDALDGVVDLEHGY